MSRRFVVSYLIFCLLPSAVVAMQRRRPGRSLHLRSTSFEGTRQTNVYLGSMYVGSYELVKNSADKNEVLLDAFWAAPTHRPLVWLRVMQALKDMQAKRLAVLTPHDEPSQELGRFYKTRGCHFDDERGAYVIEVRAQ